jgi:hypothetical protein
MADGIAYIGRIMMWWNLNMTMDQAFHYTLMLKWGTYYKIEIEITKFLIIPISFLLPIIFRS